MRDSKNKLARVRFPQVQFALAALVALATGLGSCAPSSTVQSEAEASPNQTTDQATSATSEALKIVTTTIPVTNFTKAVVGDRAEVTYLLPTNVGPHDFQARPDDVRTIAEAALLVQNGLELETFLDNLIDNAGNPELQIIDSSEGIETIATADEHAEGEAHADEHGEDHAEEHAHEHDEDHAEETEGATTAAAESSAVTDDHGHDHGAFDPHIWLDPKKAIQQVENIRDGLIAADPEGEATYTANAAAYIEQLQALDAEIAEILKPYAGQKFVTYHDFAFYFAQSYGLDTEYLVGLPEENPSPEDVRRVLETAEASNLKVLLTEPQAGEGQYAALAKDLDVQVSSFDPMETSGPEGTEPDYYLKTMRENVENLQAAFGQTQSYLLRWSIILASTVPQHDWKPVR